MDLMAFVSWYLPADTKPKQARPTSSLILVNILNCFFYANGRLDDTFPSTFSTFYSKKAGEQLDSLLRINIKH